jgi:hypothetical protein
MVWMVKMRAEPVFKLDVSSFAIAEILFLGYLLLVALEEYDGMFVETAGLTMAAIAVALGIGALLFLLIEVFRWKPS